MSTVTCQLKLASLAKTANTKSEMAQSKSGAIVANS